MTEVKPGGWTETVALSTDEILKICDQVKGLVESKTMMIYMEFLAVQYRKQLVSGTKYAIKVYVGGTSYLHLNIFQNLPCKGGEIKLIKVEENHSKDDPIIPF